MSSGKIADGRKIAFEIIKGLEPEVNALSSTLGRPLCLACVGSFDKAGCSYVKAQKKVARSLDIELHTFELEDISSTEQAIALVENLNDSDDVDGIMLHFPLPPGVEKHKVVQSISPTKDVEGLTAHSRADILSWTPQTKGLFPCTSLAAMIMMQVEGIELAGKRVVIVGASDHVGLPLCIMCIRSLATVTCCNALTSKRRLLAEYIAEAEVLFSAAGVPNLITADMLQEGVVIVDIGVSYVKNTCVGDVEFESCKVKASYITPPIGGVGPVTTAILFKNVLYAARMRLESKGR